MVIFVQNNERQHCDVTIDKMQICFPLDLLTVVSVLNLDLLGWIMVYWGDENLNRWSDFIFVTCSIFFNVHSPPLSWLYELSHLKWENPWYDASCLFQKKCAWERQEGWKSQTQGEKWNHFLLLGNCWTWVRGSVAAFRLPQFCRKNNRFGNGLLFALIWMFRACCILIVPFTRDNWLHHCTPFHGFWWTVMSWVSITCKGIGRSRRSKVEDCAWTQLHVLEVKR